MSEPTAVAQVARPEVHEAAPALGWFTDHLLYHDVWSRPGLSARDRSLLTVAVCLGSGHVAQLRSHVRRALTNGVLPSEILEIVLQGAFELGWPRAMVATPVVADELRSAGHEPASLVDVADLSAAAPGPDARTHGEPSAASIVGAYRTAVLEDVVKRRPGLSRRDRTLVSLGGLAASGQAAGARDVLGQAEAFGLTPLEVAEAVNHLGFYVGLGLAEDLARPVAADY